VGRQRRVRAPRRTPPSGVARPGSTSVLVVGVADRDIGRGAVGTRRPYPVGSEGCSPLSRVSDSWCRPRPPTRSPRQGLVATGSDRAPRGGGRSHVLVVAHGPAPSGLLALDEPAHSDYLRRIEDGEGHGSAKRCWSRPSRTSSAARCRGTATRPRAPELLHRAPRRQRLPVRGPATSALLRHHRPPATARPPRAGRTTSSRRRASRARRGSRRACSCSSRRAGSWLRLVDHRARHAAARHRPGGPLQSATITTTTSRRILTGSPGAADVSPSCASGWVRGRMCCGSAVAGSPSCGEAHGRDRGRSCGAGPPRGRGGRSRLTWRLGLAYLGPLVAGLVTYEAWGFVRDARSIVDYEVVLNALLSFKMEDHLSLADIGASYTRFLAAYGPGSLPISPAYVVAPAGIVMMFFTGSALASAVDRARGDAAPQRVASVALLACWWAARLHPPLLPRLLGGGRSDPAYGLSLLPLPVRREPPRTGHGAACSRWRWSASPARPARQGDQLARPRGVTQSDCARVCALRSGRP
jgi:hypothetical protein